MLLFSVLFVLLFFTRLHRSSYFPSYCWIIPGGADKPVKIALEGGTIVDEYVNYDRSREIKVYKKLGVRAIFSNDICMYQNTSLKREVVIE